MKMNAKVLVAAFVLMAFAAIAAEAQGNYTLSLRIYGRNGKQRRWPFGKLSFSVTQDNNKKTRVGGDRDNRLFIPFRPAPWFYRVDLPVNLTVIRSVGVSFANGDKNNTAPSVIIPFVAVTRPFHRNHWFLRRCNETRFPAGQETQYYQVRRRRARSMALRCLTAMDEDEERNSIYQNDGDVDGDDFSAMDDAINQQNDDFNDFL